MANTDFISFSLIDYKGDVGQVVVHVPTGETLTDLQTYANAVATDLDGITGMQIQSASLSLNLTIPGGLKATPVDDVDKEVGANFGFDAANTPYRHTIRVPGIDPDLRVGELIDDTDAAVLAFESEIATGNGTVAASDKYGNDLTDLIQARVTFRKD